MIQAPAEQRALVDEIVERLISKFNPTRIYLFGSRARGDARPDSDYDFLIEIAKIPDGVVINRQSITWLSDFQGAEVQIHVRSPGRLEQRKDEPGAVIDWTVIREGRLLYSAPGLPRLVAGHPSLLIRERPPLPEGLAEAWLAKAERDLYHARFHLADAGLWPDEICFLSQQSAEKFLKGLLVAYRLHPFRTHQLATLLEVLKSADVNLVEIREDCALLSRYAVAPRYPGDIDPGWGDSAYPAGSGTTCSGEDAHAAFAAAERVAVVVRANLP